MGFLARRRAELRDGIVDAVRAAFAAGTVPEAPLPAFSLEPPRAGGSGDLACNVALLLAAATRRPPREVAAAIVRHLAATDLQSAEVGGPGFINVTFSPGWLWPIPAEVIGSGGNYGCSDEGGGTPVLVEFVSANPTGPLNVVNCRAAAFGDALVRCLRAAGYRAEAEYYVNDAGNQFRKLGQSVEARLRRAVGQSGPETEIPEGGYPGEYLTDVASAYLAERGAGVLERTEEERIAALARFAVERLLDEQLKLLLRFGVRFDHVTRESAIRDARAPERALEGLAAAADASGEPYVYTRDGALWLRSTAFGDNDDRVLQKSDGEFTYRLPDIAYHLGKFERGYGRLIDILGQDHHGDVPGVLAGLQILGAPVQRLTVLITQLVRLIVEDGQAVRMSKRGGTFVGMDAFLDTVGTDAARFFFLMRTIDTHMDFDVALAQRRTQDNPVYYVQYAHARIASILRQAEATGVPIPGDGPDRAAGPDGEPLYVHPAEHELLRWLSMLPDEVAAAAASHAPHRLTVYARQTAERFHAFYVQCRVLGEAQHVTSARLSLCVATRIVLARTLELLGVTAPDSM